MKTMMMMMMMMMMTMLMMMMMMMKMTTFVMMMAMRILFARTVMVIICLEGIDFKGLDDHHLQVVVGRSQESFLWHKS